MKFLIILVPLALTWGSVLCAPSEDEANQAPLRLQDPWEELRSKDWQPHQAVAVGDFHSLVFQTKSAGGLMAEYFQRVFLFGGTAREGKFLQAFQLTMNTGGRTHMLLYRHLSEKGEVQFVTFEDRFGEQHISIPKRAFHPEGQALPAGLKKEFLGTFSGEAVPAKFFTPLVLTETAARKDLE